MCLGGPESELGHMWLVALVLDETFVEGGQAGGPYPWEGGSWALREA